MRSRGSVRHGVYAGMAVGFAVDPVLVRNVLAFALAAAFIVCGIYAEVLRWRR